jgi:hypothetical protein
MTIEVLADADAVARRATTIIAAEARAAAAARGRFIMDAAMMQLRLPRAGE